MNLNVIYNQDCTHLLHRRVREMDDRLLCISFGDSSAVVISRGNIKNAIPEVKLVYYD